MKVFHKGTCVTCKKTISELERMGVEFKARDFFKEPLTESELKRIIANAGISPKEALRKKDRMYKELDLANAEKTDGQLIKLMVKHPGLIKRPIIITKDKITIGKTDVGGL